MEFQRIESIQGNRIFAIFEISREEYSRIIDQRNAAAQRERENEEDRQRERDWYAEDNTEY